MSVKPLEKPTSEFPNDPNQTGTSERKSKFGIGKRLGAAAAVGILGAGAALGLSGGEKDFNPFKNSPSFSANGKEYELTDLEAAPADPTALADLYKSPVGSESFENIVDDGARESLENDSQYGYAASEFINNQEGILLRDIGTYEAIDTKARNEVFLYSNLDKFSDADAAKETINPPAIFTVEDLQASSAGTLSENLRNAIISAAGFSPEGLDRTHQLGKLVAMELGDDKTDVSPEVKELLHIAYADNEYQEANVDALTGEDDVDDMIASVSELRDSDPESLKAQLETPTQVTSVSVVDTVFYDYDTVPGRGLTTIDANITYVQNGVSISEIKRLVVVPANEVQPEDGTVAMKLLNVSDVNLTQS